MCHCLKMFRCLACVASLKKQRRREKWDHSSVFMSMILEFERDIHEWEWVWVIYRRSLTRPLLLTKPFRPAACSDLPVCMCVCVLSTQLCMFIFAWKHSQSTTCPSCWAWRVCCRHRRLWKHPHWFVVAPRRCTSWAASKSLDGTSLEKCHFPRSG